MKPKTSARIYFDENEHRAVVSLNTYKVRISRDGMTFEEALTTPPKRTNKVSYKYIVGKPWFIYFSWDDDYKIRWDRVFRTVESLEKDIDTTAEIKHEEGIY